MAADISVVGVGNIIMQDEGFGVECAKQLEKITAYPDFVQILDGGTLGMDLMPYITGTKKILFIDAINIDAPMVEEVLSDLDLANLDVVIIENVGNLVCPAEFVVGEDMKVTVLSITEGDDKPLKYPIIFKESKVAILNKVDILPFTNFDMDAAKHDLKCIHPQLKILETNALKGDGVDEWCDFIRSEFKAKQQRLAKE